MNTTSRRVHGGEVLGATPAHPLLVPALSAAPDLSMGRQQALLDLQAIRRIPGLAGYWPASPEYLFEDSAGTIPANTTGTGVVGAWVPIGSTPGLGDNLYPLGDCESALPYNKGDGFGSVSTYTLNTDSPISGTQDSRLVVTTGTASNRPTLGPASVVAGSIIVGATYRLTFDYKVNSGAFIITSINNGTIPLSVNSTLTGTGTFSYDMVCGSTTSFAVLYVGNSVCDVQIDNVTLRQRIGAAFQATTANKPYLRKTPTSNVHWLDSNTSTSALNVALSDTALGRRNLLTYTEDFSNAAWGKTRIAVTANADTAPDGTSTAFKVESTALGGVNSLVYSASLGTAGQPLTYSFYAKAGTARYVQVTPAAALIVAAWLNIDLVTGTVGTSSGITAAITPTENGYYRCSVTVTSSLGSGTNPLTIYIVDSASATRAASYTGGSVGDHYFLWHPQAENSATATDYQRIVSAPAYCTVARATAEGVTFTENAEITPSYNIAPAFGFNADIAIFNRALTITEKALLTRYMQRGVPVLGTELVTNGNFDSADNWTVGNATGTLDITDGLLTITNTSVGGYARVVNSVPFAVKTTEYYYVVAIRAAGMSPWIAGAGYNSDGSAAAFVSLANATYSVLKPANNNSARAILALNTSAIAATVSFSSLSIRKIL